LNSRGRIDNKENPLSWALGFIIATKLL